MIPFAKQELKVLWPFYLSTLLQSLATVYWVFMTPYFLSIGYSLTQIGVILSLFALGAFLFEVPTGAIADIYGRKTSVILGGVLDGLNLMCIIFTTNYYLICLLFFLRGVILTLGSGSNDAWIVDLSRKKKLNIQSTLFPKKQSLLNIGVLVSGLIGAMAVTNYGLGSIWIGCGTLIILGTILLSFAEDDMVRQRNKRKSHLSNMLHQTAESIKYVKNNKTLFYLMIISFFMMVHAQLSALISWTPFLTSLSMPSAWFGYIWSTSGLLGIVAPLISHKVSSKYKERKTMIVLLSIGALLSISTLFVNTVAMAIAILIASWFIFDMRYPIGQTYLHLHTPSKKRATIASMISMVVSFGGILSTAFAGVLVDSIGARHTIAISSIALIVATAYLRKAK